MMSLPFKWSISCWSGGRKETLGGKLLALPLAVDVGNRHGRGTLDVEPEIRDRQAAFLVQAQLLALGQDFRVDERQRLRCLLVLGDIEDDEAFQNSDLNGGETNARRGVHGLEHVVGKLQDLPIDLLDRGGDLSQDGIRHGDDSQLGHWCEIRKSRALVNRPVQLASDG